MPLIRKILKRNYLDKLGMFQSFSLGLIRSDYMIDNKIEKLSVKQVEMNTIASSLAGLCTQFSLLHR